MNMKISENKFVSESVKDEKVQQSTTDPISQDRPAGISVNEIPSSLLRGAYGVVPFSGNMQTRPQSKAVPFTANPLYDINLRKLTNDVDYKNIPAKFSELIIGDDIDHSAMKKLKELWKHITDYGSTFADNFDKQKAEKSYYLTEVVDDSKSLYDRITCVVETTNPKKSANKDVFDIHLLQASPKLANKQASEIKGSGELSLYGAVKVAKENEFKKISLISTNDSFYDKMGFEKVDMLDPDESMFNEGGIYELAADKYDDFLNKIEQKYNLSK